MFEVKDDFRLGRILVQKVVYVKAGFGQLGGDLHGEMVYL
jgi:hypothetical protein